MIIKSINNLDEDAPVTFLSSDEAAGTTVLRVKNTAAMTTGWAVQIGKTGEERAEVQLGTAPNVGTINVAATDFVHPANTPIYFIKYNQVVFEKSTTGTTGTATPITDGTIKYQADGTITQFDDTAGATTHAYRTRFRNSTLGINTSQSDWTVIAPEFYWLSSMRERVKEKLWNANFITNNQIDNWLNEWKDEMTNVAIAVNEDYAIGTVNVAFGTGGLGTVTTSDFKQPKKLEVTYNGNDYFLSTKQMINEFVPDQEFNSTHPYHNWEGDTVFHVKPPEDGGTAKIYFYRLGTPMVNDTDGLPLPLRGYTKSFVDYALGQAYQKDGKTTEASIRLADANAQKSMFVGQISPHDRTGPTMIFFTDVVDGENYY